jgi:hypothetical protein
MKKIHLVDDCGIPEGNILVFVSEYRIGYYDGDGMALALFSDGSIVEYDLGHCSCYGPLESGSDRAWNNRKEFKKEADSVLLLNSSAKLCSEFLEAIKGVRTNVHK